METTERHTVVIPANTLIHVGGLPFRTITDTTVEGNEGNLRLGLESLAQLEPRTGSGGASYTFTHDAGRS